MKKISKYISYVEATKSAEAIRKGIDNTPTEDQVDAMMYVAKNGFDKVREHVGDLLGLNSFFRSPELNVSLGGAKSSQHMKGEAIDIDCDLFGHGSNKEVFEWIQSNLEFDQVIAEAPKPDGDYEWIHLSMVDPLKGRKNRKEVLYAKFVDGKWRYSHSA